MNRTTPKPTGEPFSRPQAVIPMVIERGLHGERAFDIYSRLLRERIIVLGTPIDDQVASVIIAQLLLLESADPESDILLYINSPGGAITSCLAIYDTMQLVRPDVSPLCMGIARGMATVLLAGGARGKRYCLPHATVHMQPAPGGISGYAPDVEVQARELLREQQLVRGLLANDTGQPLERIMRDFDRELYMTAEQAREYGIVDEIMVTSDIATLAHGDTALIGA